MTGPDVPASFRLGYVPGVTPGKWARIWAERLPDVGLELVTVTTADAEDAVRTGAVDAAVLRLPIDRAGLHAIPLYTETTVVVVPKDHVATAVDELTVDDLADELVLHPPDAALVWDGPAPGTAAATDPATTADAVELVAAGVGVLVVPQSLARLHHRRDLTYRPLTGGPTSSVVLSWPDAETSELMEQFIGIVRGRTVNSSRTPPRATERRPAAPARTPARRPARRGRPRR
ncbi:MULTISPECIES: LysR substrate-binding domain-containing protein [Pseudonocardia]|uniref:Hca operon transcriptional activator n=2 Tax=Pseudonocardia TaxID=1847 RepID=A0A1Y2MZV9_PSEAH|nr:MULTISPECIES: LysR substrate-binding domain-containing protein [Pseudonocardia]OSY40581.1 Hca operon transcriptional activator [Pseudonocardia autotrophica]TDN73623.1 LysR substrate binding domain-containing protein [Pseudonocardia autotrophica]BBG04367.1 LysR family transcriptional regulator [Pseudonocardia autotrophica]GEC25233.1 LysR family transcriptional regulator [Pseudonocardia saturnea]